MVKNPKVSIIIPTLCRETLYPLINNLLKQEVSFDYEIILIPQVKLKENLLKDKKIKFYYEPLGKGFAYYRNKGIEKSTGEIIVFIDDDEMPMNNKWLDNITLPLIRGKEDVVTAGVKIKLGQGYLTDSSSLLGFPGGGAVGFKIMWEVNKNNYTKHLCSGNLAIKKFILKKVGNFEIEMKNGNEDVNLANKLISYKILIKYLEEATVYHVARKGLINFIKWNYLRGKSVKGYISYNQTEKPSKIIERLNSSCKILKKVSLEKIYYLPGVLFMMINQYFWQGIGVFWGKMR